METLDLTFSPDRQEEQFNQAVRQVFSISGITYGSSAPGKQTPLVYNPTNGAPLEYIVRYTGNLSMPSENAYDRLADLLKPHSILPIFRLENKQQVIYLISSAAIPTQKRPNPWINLLLFVLTLFSVLFTGGIYGLQELPQGAWQVVSALVANGWPFALSMLGILAVHEFGHYFAGRSHGLDVSLPYFIPFPLSVMGTMGAFINMRSIPKNRNHLLDVGIAGPLAGFVVAVPILWIGLKQSVLTTLPNISTAGAVLQLEGNSLFYLLMKFLAFGRLLPEPTSYQGLPVLFYWISYFFSGHPLPSGGLDVSLNGVAWAGWCGLLVTALNLMPAGQLDGGHVSYILFGRKWVRRFYPALIGLTLLLGFIWSGWWLWAVLLYFFGRYYAEPLDQITPLSSGRKVLAILAVIIFFLTFIPVPFNGTF